MPITAGDRLRPEAVNLSELSDEELRSYLPSDYNNKDDEAINRGLRRMRWINAIRQNINADTGLWIIECYVNAQWELWASVSTKSLLNWCCDVLRKDGLKVRFKEIRR